MCDSGLNCAKNVVNKANSNKTSSICLPVEECGKEAEIRAADGNTYIVEKSTTCVLYNIFDVTGGDEDFTN